MQQDSGGGCQQLAWVQHIHFSTLLKVSKHFAFKYTWKY